MNGARATMDGAIFDRASETTRWTKLLAVAAAVGFLLASSVQTSQAVEFTVNRASVQVSGESTPSPYLLLTTPVAPAGGKHPLIVYLYGRGGSIDSYNLAAPAYATIRQLAAERGYDILVPELGTDHWMNARAQKALDAMIADAISKNPINPEVVHLMGTSMGGGSALAYAVHRPEMVRSVSAFMGISDFSQWVGQNATYLRSVSEAYGGSPDVVPAAYNETSAMKNLDAFQNIPVFLIHGAADTLVPTSQSVQLSTALNTKGYDVTYREAAGLGHDDAAVTPYQREVVDFLDKVTARVVPEPKAVALLVTGSLFFLPIVSTHLSRQARRRLAKKTAQSDY